MAKEVQGGVLKSFSELNPAEDEAHNNRILQGVITAISDIEHYDLLVEVECPKCHSGGKFTCLGQDFRQFKPPTMCLDCKQELEIKKVNRARLRKIQVQEDIQKEPQTLTCFLFGDNVLKTQAGEKVDIRGQLRSVKKHKTDKVYQRVFDINQIRNTKQEVKLPDSIMLNHFKSLKFEDLINSIAPNIMGMEKIKESMLISMIGGVNRDDVRGDINMLMVGDPGTAKTKLLEFITSVIQPSAYASGRSASAAGLLAGVDNLSDGTRVARAGVVVLCNGGVVALDEMDKMSNTDRSALHESMSTQHFSLVKIGINRKWEVKTTIIGAANPYGGNKYDPSVSIKDNIRLSDSLLSRFALIFLVLDEPDLDHDREVAQHIIRARQGKIISPLNVESLSMYINYAKTFCPVISDEAGSFLLDWWSKLRQESQKDNTPEVDHRVMEDLNRITEAYARARFSNEATIDDAERAVDLLSASLHSLFMNTPGERAESSGRGMNKDEWVKHVFSSPVSERQAVINLCKKQKYFKSYMAATRYIEKLREAGLIKQHGLQDEWIWVN